MNPFRNQENFIISFFNNSDFGFQGKIFFCSNLVDILSFGSGSVDPHIKKGSNVKDLYCN